MRFVKIINNKKFTLISIFLFLYVFINLLEGERGIISYLEKQKIKPLIDKTFPIDKFREAFDYQLAAKNRRGKIVITV